MLIYIIGWLAEICRSQLPLRAHWRLQVKRLDARLHFWPPAAKPTAFAATLHAAPGLRSNCAPRCTLKYIISIPNTKTIYKSTSPCVCCWACQREAMLTLNATANRTSMSSVLRADGGGGRGGHRNRPLRRQSACAHASTGAAER
jgi:hypothetical protein